MPTPADTDPDIPFLDPSEPDFSIRSDAVLNAREQSWWAPIDRDEVTFAAADPLPLQFQHFLDVIDGNAEPLASGAEGLQTLRVINAIKAACESGSAQMVG